MSDPEHQHSHRVPRTLIVLIAVCVAGLLAGVVLSFMRAQATDARLAVIEEYIEGRGEFRDREAERLERAITRGICDLLDQLPSTALLDQVRSKYDCGPGLALEELPPEVRSQLGRPPSTAAPAAPASPAAQPPGATEPAPRPEPPTAAPAAPSAQPLPPPGAEPEPTTSGQPPSQEPPPLVDLEPITDPLCAVVGVCL